MQKQNQGGEIDVFNAIYRPAGNLAAWIYRVPRGGRSDSFAVDCGCNLADRSSLSRPPGSLEGENRDTRHHYRHPRCIDTVRRRGSPCAAIGATANSSSKTKI